MKKRLIMAAAIGVALAGGVVASGANAAPLQAGSGLSDRSTNLAEQVHYRRHYGHHHHHDRGWRRWRPRMFGYWRHRHHHHHHHHHHRDRRHYY